MQPLQVGKVNGSADVVTAAHSVVPVETLLDLHAYDGESERPDKFEEKGYLFTYIQISCSQIFNYVCMARKVSTYIVTFYTLLGPIWTHQWVR